MGLFFLSCTTNNSVQVDLKEWGLYPDTEENATAYVLKAMENIREKYPDTPITLLFEKGTYKFHPSEDLKKEYYISNHDQVNPKYVGIAIEGFKNFTLEGNGSSFVFHDRMLPVSVLNSENIRLQNFSIDFDNPHISQVKILSNDKKEGIIEYEVAPWVEYEIKDGQFFSKGKSWSYKPFIGIAFEEDTKRLVYQTSDINAGTDNVEDLGDRKVRAKWNHPLLNPGTVVAMRSYYRPAPGIFMSNNKDANLQNIQIHYAEGMGLLAQMSENITLDGFSVCLKGDDDPRYFTTQADATHFSGCKGTILSKNGLYEGMMDDAINVHGTYLKITKRTGANSVHAKYMHGQAYGFMWGEPGDQVNFVEASLMETVGKQNKVRSIRPIDQPQVSGAKEFELVFEDALSDSINENCGIENLTWTPEVIFENNIIRNNRARGSLFSTPRSVIVRNNLFDHTSGSAILLAGDCNGWFETGACRDVQITNNRFINPLTMLFQFTNAVISIYPEIPNLSEQKKFFHQNVVIEDNYFEVFDAPLLYAKSINGLTFRRNTIIQNNDYPAFHWNKNPFFFEHVNQVEISENTFDSEFDSQNVVKTTYSTPDAVRYID
ncbi:MAG: right-handed parallel beta-helix repeat-containing protein [Bacteroidales bacterium]